jgi:hypothetical protein
MKFGTGALVVWLMAAGGQALLPAGSDHTKVLTYEGSFRGGDYYPSPAEIEVQKHAAATMERALAKLTADPAWHVNESDDFRKHESEPFPGGTSRAGLMSCGYSLELEIDHDSKAFTDMQAENERKMQAFQRMATEAQAAAARGDAAALKKLQASQPTLSQPMLTVRVGTNPRDVSGYMDPANRKLMVPGADYAFATTSTEPGARQATTVGLGAIVRNTTGGGYFIKLKPSRLWRTQHFVEVVIEGDPAMASQVLSKIDLSELKRILDL